MCLLHLLFYGGPELVKTASEQMVSSLGHYSSMWVSVKIKNLKGSPKNTYDNYTEETLNKTQPV